MSENKNYLRTILKGDPIPKKYWKKLTFYSVLVICLSLLITSVSVVNYSPETDIFGENGEEFLILRDASGIATIEIPRWSFIVFIIAGFGVSLVFIGDYLGKTLLFKRKEWLESWKNVGEIRYRRFGRKAVISTEKGDIIITKANENYILELPVIEKKDFTKYGFLKMNGDYLTLTNEEELFGTIHLFISLIS
jgi:hypothetical protein